VKVATEECSQSDTRPHAHTLRVTRGQEPVGSVLVSNRHQWSLVVVLCSLNASVLPVRCPG
jgi:hypothetical protein